MDPITAAMHVAQAPQAAPPQTKFGWWDAMRQQDHTVPTITGKAYDTMRKSERFTYNSLRMRHHESLACIETRHLSDATAALTQRFTTLSGARTVCCGGMLISGPACAGKSTTLIHFGQQIETGLRAGKKLPLHDADEPPARLPGGAEYIPVAYVTLTTQVISTLENIARFYIPELPRGKKRSRSELLAMIADLVYASETRLILMDQLQNLRSATVGAQAVSDVLKDLMDACPSTMIAGAGINLERLPIFSAGERDGAQDLAQTGNRFALHPMGNYDTSTKDGLTDWIRLLRSVEEHLKLHNQQKNDLVNMRDLLHERTKGLTGVIMPLLRAAANHAITDGSERITVDTINAVYTSVIRDIDADFITVEKPTRTQAAVPPRKNIPRRKGRHNVLTGTPSPNVAVK